MTSPAMVCLTPVKNEAWILDRFLTCAALWADRIIVADQQSSDASRDIASRHAKVTVIENPAAEYGEARRQQLLIDAARAVIPGPKVLIALDADEFLSANFRAASDWEAARYAPPGTVLEFARIELLPRAQSYFRDSVADGGIAFPYGFVDDGTPHTGPEIHSPRVPIPTNARRLRLTQTVVLHFQFCDTARMESKHRWYRCFERLRYPDKRPTAIYRTYDWFERTAGTIRPIQAQWLDGYRAFGVDMTAPLAGGPFWWDWEVLRMFAEHGPEHFRGQDIWQVPWEAIRRQGVGAGVPGLPPKPIVDPRRWRDRFALWWLHRTGRLPMRRGTDRLFDLIWNG